MNCFDLKDHELVVAEVHHNLAPSHLYEHAIRHEKAASIAENGALVAYSGAKTGRSPKDKRVVKHPDSEQNIWWGNVNIPCDARTFAINRQRALDYLNTRDRLYCFDGFAGWDPKYRIKVRVICSRPYHALFMHTMLIRPTKDELALFGRPDFTIYNEQHRSARPSTHMQKPSIRSVLPEIMAVHTIVRRQAVEKNRFFVKVFEGTLVDTHFFKIIK